MQTPEAPPPPPDTSLPPAPSASPDARSTAFQAVQAGTEQHSGSTLLIEAYAALWLILMAWLFVLWKKQANLHTRIDDLERILAKADAKK